MVTQAYCRRCGCKRNILNPEIKEVTSSRRGVMKLCVGNCEICNNRISVILPKEIITNNKINKLQEEINLEKEKEEDKKKIDTFLKQSEENPIIQRNQDIIEVVDKTEKKVIKKSYYTLFKIFLVLFGLIILILLYRTIYPEYFIPNYNSPCEVNLNETLFCNNTNINTDSCNCGDNYCNITFPDKIEVSIKNGTG